MSDEWREENASVEVQRWGPCVHLTIRSEQSVGKSIELSLEEARSLAKALSMAASSAAMRRIKDEPQA